MTGRSTGGCSNGPAARIAARIGHFDSIERDACCAGGFVEHIRRSDHDRMRDFPLNETARRGKHTRVFTFGQNDLEMAAPCYIETTFDRIHVHLGENENWRRRARMGP